MCILECWIPSSPDIWKREVRYKLLENLEIKSVFHKFHCSGQWYWGLWAISYIEHPVRLIIESSTHIKCHPTWSISTLERQAPSPPKFLICVFYKVVQKSKTSQLSPMKVYWSQQWYLGLRTILFIEHPVRSITKSSSLIKCCPKYPCVFEIADLRPSRSSKYMLIL